MKLLRYLHMMTVEKNWVVRTWRGHSWWNDSSRGNKWSCWTPKLSQANEIIDKVISWLDEVIGEVNTAIAAVDVVDGFALYSASLPVRKKAAIDVDDIWEDLQEAAAAAAKANVDVAMAAAAVGGESLLTIAEFDCPGRGLLHVMAAKRQQQQADRMKKRSFQENSAKEDIPVGGVVLVKIDKVDHSKLDNKRFTCVVVEVMEWGQYHLMCKGGASENVYICQDLHYEENKTPALYE
jgi:hypothetical protein